MNQLLVRAMKKKQAPVTGICQASGQTLIIFALMLVALVALVGIAVDVGFGFVRASQFSAAVDAAALAGVVDLDPHAENDTSEADVRAEQFLAANGWPLDNATTFVSGRAFTNLGIPDYTITVTWPVESFFMRVFGIEGFPVTRSATAAYFAQAEMYTATAYDRSHARKASLFIFGPQACTFAGDPVSPRLSTSGQPNEGYHLANGVYRYAFRIPANYASDRVRVELFDTDSVNFNQGAIYTVTHSLTYALTGPSETLMSCSPGGDGEACVLYTEENRDSVFHNPYWFVRVDETWDGSCTQIKNIPSGNTVTRFELYYLNDQGQRVPLGTYVETNNNLFNTDMRWVSPGALGPAGTAPPVPADFGSFEVEIGDIPPALANARYIYLDVRAESGNSKNVFDVRGGLPGDVLGEDWLVFNRINERNLTLANGDPAFDPSGGVETFALGRMPIQTYYDNAYLKLPLVPVSTTLVDGVIYATVFDYDHESRPEIEFTIDTLSPVDFRVLAKITDDPGSLPAYGIAGLCNGSLDCDNAWIWPQFRLGVPTFMYESGTLFAEYIARRNAHTWSVSITSGRPVLTR